MKPLRVLGKYELLEKIGSGGMAEVYMARLTGVEGFEKIVVVKKILPGYARNLSFIQMLIQEAKLTSVLQHPNIVQIFELDNVEGQYYIAMEFVDGKDLLKVLARCADRRQLLPAEVACFIASEVCKGLHYAHRARDIYGNPLNIIHRDVSPSNVIMSWDGHVKIMDFGVAKARTEEAQGGKFVLRGKLGYMSPEQVRNEELDARSDVFSLGVVLFESVTLKRLFIGKSDLDTLINIRDVNIDKKLLRFPHLDEGLKDVLRKALARDRDERFATAQEFQIALTDYLFSKGYRLDSVRLSQFLEKLFHGEGGGSGEHGVVSPGTSRSILTGGRPVSEEGEGGTDPNVAVSGTGEGPSRGEGVDFDAEMAREVSRGSPTGGIPGASSGVGFPAMGTGARPGGHVDSAHGARHESLTGSVGAPETTGGRFADDVRTGRPLIGPDGIRTEGSRPGVGTGARFAEPSSPDVNATQRMKTSTWAEESQSGSGFPSPGVSRPTQGWAPPGAAVPPAGSLRGVAGEGRGVGASAGVQNRVTTTDHSTESPWQQNKSKSGPQGKLSGSQEAGFSDSPQYRLKNTAGFVFGPVDYPNLVSLVQTGAVSEDEYVSIDGADWKRVREITAVRTLSPNDALRARGVSPIYSGTVSKPGVVRVFFQIASRQLSGKLRFVRGSAQKEFYFLKGRPKHVASNLKQELLGPFLLQRGIVTEEQMKEALAKCGEFSGRLGDSLVSLGFVKPHELYWLLDLQFREKFVQIFAWDKGTYEFYENVPCPVEMAPSDFNVYRYLLEGVRKYTTSEELEPFFRPHAASAIREKKNAFISIDKLPLSSRELRIWGAIQRLESFGRVLREAATTEEGKLSLFQLLLVLYQLELITFQPTK